MSFSLYVLTGGVIVMIILALLSVGRLFLGPTTADRLVALDTINTFVVGIMILISVITDSIVMVDVAIVYCALSFVGAMFLARYMEGGI
ncbi:MAG: monovalent cation/H+ antiporter complex subunit F [Synergistaceae bacterium]|nr:monovalent cation/H+ antiporter complex subunit F [Synergistaceae bacterium]